MKHRVLLGMGIGLTLVTDAAVLLAVYGHLGRSVGIVLASWAAALVMFAWSVRAPYAWGAMALLYFFGEALFLPFADFAGFSTNDLFFPALVLPWILLGIIQFFVVCVRVRMELGAEKKE